MTVGANAGQMSLVRTLAWIGCAASVAVYLTVVYSPIAAFARLVLLELIYSVPITITIVLGSVATMRSSGVERRFWALLTAANASLLACEALLVWWIARVSPAGPPSVAWPFQGLHLVAAACFLSLVITMTRLQDDAPSVKIRVSLDFVAASILVYVAILGLYARPVMMPSGAPAYTVLVGAAYPLASVLLVLGTLVNVVGFKFVRWRTWEQLVAIALAIYAVAISLWPLWSLSVVGTTRNFERGLLDTLQLTAHLILMMGAVYRLTESPDWQLRPLPAPAVARSRWLSMLLPAVSIAVIPLLGYQAFTSQGDPVWFAAYGTLAVALTAIVLARSVVLALEHSMLFHRSVTDPLTGLFNHRFFHDRLGTEFDRARRYGDPLSVVVIDIDDFGQFNAANGHSAGDRLLAGLGAKLESACRGGEVVARLGGDEFGLLLPERDSRESAVVCQRLLDLIGIEGGLVPGGLSASAGVASFPADATEPGELLRIADGALFHAKETGKNRVVVFEAGRVPDLNARERIQRLELQSRVSAVRALAAAVDARDPATRDHSQNVALLVVALGHDIGLAEERLRMLELAAVIHDVGKLGVSEAVLNKPGPLTAAEWAEVRTHCELGQHILAATDLVEVVPWVRAHHERWDGTGYPDGLRGEEIPFEARLLAVCDAFDAMTSQRAYRQGMSHAQAIAEIRNMSGTQFDPALASSLCELLVSSEGERELLQHRAQTRRLTAPVSVRTAVADQGAGSA